MPFEWLKYARRCCTLAPETEEVSIVPISPASACPPASPASACPPAKDYKELEETDLKETDEHFIFHWLDWAPEINSSCFRALHMNFPGALPGEALNNQIRSVLKREEHGFTTENTLVGYSLCPDEINFEPGCLVDQMKEEWGHMFPLGGISGAPFVGVTGFGAFSHHVPKDGNIIIIFGPHVAVSAEGLVGKVLREGQDHLSTACGAVIGAFNACCTTDNSRKGDETEYNPVDMQMGWIKSQIEPHTEFIKSKKNVMAALAYQAYEMVQAKLEKIVNLDFGSGKLALIGGIQINLPPPFQEHFLPLSFELRQKGSASQNLLFDLNLDLSDEKIDFARQWTPTSPTPKAMKRLSTTDYDTAGLERQVSPEFQEFRTVPKANFDHRAELKEDQAHGRQHAVFAWLTWSPEPGNACFKTLHKEFPGALPGPGVHCKLRWALRERFGFTQASTLFGTSICPDEINNQSHGLAALMASYWGAVFPLGGLAGVPFTGKTGFKAFSHHVPVNGDIIVLYGPHVGISESGEVGKYLRQGQDGLSLACGACIGAYNICLDNTATDGFHFDETDLQFGFIKSSLVPHAKRIEKQKCPMAALSYQTFESVKNIVNKVVNTDFGSGRLVLIGGIQINMPEPCSDHFLPLSCEVQQANKAPVDIKDVFNLDE